MYFVEGLVVGQNFIPSSSRPSMLSAQAHPMGNAQFIGMTEVMLLLILLQCLFDLFILHAYITLTWSRDTLDCWN